MEGTDARMQTEVPPPQRGMTDGSTTAEDVAPPPVDAGVDVSRPADVAMPVDRQPDLVNVVDAQPDVGVVRCMVATANCPDGMYCLSPNCGVNGTCQPVPANVQQAPVCGCDRITYWNAGVAAANSASVRVDGACPAGVACGAGIGAATCPAGAICNLEQATDATCNQNATGRCWTLPAACPALPAGTMPTTRRCVGGGNNPCLPACELIQAGRIYFTDPTCP